MLYYDRFCVLTYFHSCICSTSRENDHDINKREIEESVAGSSSSERVFQCVVIVIKTLIAQDKRTSIEHNSESVMLVDIDCRI